MLSSTPDRSEPLSIGVSEPRTDAFPKVEGRELYAADLYPEEMLWAGALRAGRAHALIGNIDDFRARSLPGVVGILTAGDIDGPNGLGIMPPFDQPVLAEDRIRYVGDPVCLVLAENREVLKEALNLIEVEYEPLPAVFNPEEALRKDAPLVHPGRKEGNLLLSAFVRRGDVDEALRRSSFMVEEIFSFPCQEHAYLETETGVAVMETDGTICLTVSTQNPFRDRMEVAHALGLPPERVRVRAPYLGGGFGGKDGVTTQGLLALAALHAGGRPVKMHNSREESFLCSPKRHSAKTTVAIGCDEEGYFTALRCRIVMDGGAYATMSVPVLTNSVDHAGGCYRFPSVDVEGLSVYTNNPPGGAFRAFGAPQVEGSLEQVVDLLAERAGLDPLKMRMINVLHRGDVNSSGVTLSHTTGISACLRTLSEDPLWRERERWRSEAPSGKLRGTGISAIAHGQGFGPGVPDFANARLELMADGRFRVYSGISDMGQGNASTYGQLVGEVLNQGSGDMEIVQPDTDVTLRSGPAAASRTTFVYGNALIKAAKEMKGRLLRIGSMMMGGLREEEMVLLPGRVRHSLSGREISLSAVASAMEEPSRTVVANYLTPVAAVSEDTDYGPRNMGFPHLIFSYAAHLARIEVDRLTGEVRGADYLAVTDGGRVLNPQAFHQQIEGGVAQGLGYALMEDFRVSEGRIETPNFATYIVPTSLDVPPIRSLAVELDEEEGPFGQKGIGELPLIGPLPAVANGLRRITGTLMRRSPYTAERVLCALEEEECHEDKIQA